jgi:hypothetical protein
MIEAAHRNLVDKGLGEKPSDKAFGGFAQMSEIELCAVIPSHIPSHE